MKKEPKFKNGQKVHADNLGYGVIVKVYWANNEWLYQIKQKEYLLGNVPENFIRIIKSQKTT